VDYVINLTVNRDLLIMVLVHELTDRLLFGSKEDLNQIREFPTIS